VTVCEGFSFGGLAGHISLVDVTKRREEKQQIDVDHVDGKNYESELGGVVQKRMKNGPSVIFALK
jgi:hypothetical protein